MLAAAYQVDGFNHIPGQKYDAAPIHNPQKTAVAIAPPQEPAFNSSIFSKLNFFIT